MGLFIRQNENRSELQERLAAELREKAKLQAAGTEPVDQTKQSNYVKDTEEVSTRSWVLAALGMIVAIGVVIYFIAR